MSARMRATALAAAITAASVVGATPAWAHVHASSPGAVRGGVAMVTFEVPNESPNGSATTELTVTLPDVASARTETKPGWTARLDRDPKSGAVHSVTWTATAGAGIGADQFGQRLRMERRRPHDRAVNSPRRRAHIVQCDRRKIGGGRQGELIGHRRSALAHLAHEANNAMDCE